MLRRDSIPLGVGKEGVAQADVHRRKKCSSGMQEILIEKGVCHNKVSGKGNKD